ncbi:MAG: dethiobiotin synthase [Hyphomicrobium sp.]|nr:dethiobiotin synthase [Hyphomicrobium sp.]
MPAVFVTATGTDIGKTFVTAGLAIHLRQQGRKVAILKPVLSGFDATDAAASDPALLLQALDQGLSLEPGNGPSLAAIAAISPWRFAAPLSPDMAARREGRAIDFADLLAFCRKAVETADDVLLIEGIGGLMVPLTTGATVLDLVEALQIVPILVAGTYVGSLSHTLSAIEVLERRAIRLGALVLNETPGSAASPEETAESLRNFYRAPPILTFRRGAAPENADSFGQLADLLLPA